jgi:hypothetical protein
MPPEKTHGIPGKCEFWVRAVFPKSTADKEGYAIDDFWRHFGEFTFVFEYETKKYEKTFSKRTIENLINKLKEDSNSALIPKEAPRVIPKDNDNESRTQKQTIIQTPKELEPPDPKPTVRDVWLLNAVHYIAYQSWVLLDMPLDEKHLIAGYRALSELKQKAFDGELPIWGRVGQAELFKPIPKEYWEYYGFEILSFAKDNPEEFCTEKYSDIANDVIYNSLMTSKAKVEGLWPSRLPEVTPDFKAIQLRELAKNKGWDFSESHIKSPLANFIHAIKQSGHDGELKIYGRAKKDKLDELTRDEVLKEIPKEHWEEYEIDRHSLIESIENISIVTYIIKTGEKGYADLHFNESQCKQWLEAKEQNSKSVNNPNAFEGEEGYLDLIELSQDSMNEVSNITGRITMALEKMEEEVRKETSRINELNATEKKEVNLYKKSTNRAAESMEKFSKVLIVEIPNFKRAYNDSLKSFVSAANLGKEDFENSPDDFKDSLEGLIGLDASLSSAFNSMEGMFLEIKNLPRTTTRLNQAKKKTLKATDELLAEMKLSSQLTKEAIANIQKLIQDKD